MGETTLDWIFGIFLAWMIALTVLIYGMLWEMKKVKLAVELFVNENGKGAAIILHSSDNHLGLDELLDTYKASNYNLTDIDWSFLKARCEQIRADKSLTIDERLAANTMIASFLAQLKLSGREIGSDFIHSKS